MDENVRNFLEGILQDASIQIKNDETKEEMIKELFARLDKYVSTVILENLPSDQLDTFIRLNEEKKSQEEIETFLKEKIANVEELFAKAFADFRDLYIGSVVLSSNKPHADQVN